MNLRTLLGTAAVLLVAAPAAAQAVAGTTADAIAEARRLTGENDLLGAATVLEQALLEDANANDARALYAATLCRLGDRTGAAVEVDKLAGQVVSDTAWADVNVACGDGFARPAKAQARVRPVSGEAYAGIAFDSDAGASINRADDLFSFGPRRDPGHAVTFGIAARYRAPSTRGNGGMYGGFSLDAKRDFQGPDQRYTLGEARLGWARDNARLGYEVGAVARYLQLFDEKYSREWGGQLGLTLGDIEKGRVHARAELVGQDYGALFPGASGDGTHYDASVAYEARLGGGGFWTLGAGAERKNARDRQLGYDGARLFAAAFLPGAADSYWSLSANARLLDYHDDEAYNPDRKDRRLFARVAYGTPLGWQGLTFEPSLSYSHRHTKIDESTLLFGAIDIPDYDNVGAEARLIWKY